MNEWEKGALCAQVDSELFFPDQGGSAREAKAVCMACDVRAECLAWALVQTDLHGIWGGKSERERMALRSAAREAAA